MFKQFSDGVLSRMLNFDTDVEGGDANVGNCVGVRICSKTMVMIFDVH